jgi:hypothetical protein
MQVKAELIVTTDNPSRRRRSAARRAWHDD